MSEATTIRILEKDNNRRGDLFGRLMADLFVALGYEQPRLNIHKSGRELDLSAEHRLEPRRAVAECKATSETIGGDEVNKFVGALDAERRDKRPVTGYFISLAGFKETAIEQERQGRRTKIITLTGPQVVSELVRGRIIVPMERATEVAGRSRGTLDDLTLDPDAELLAHELGWIWAVYYTKGKARSHFVLVSSDGTPLARAVADEVVAADRRCRGMLYLLSCLNPAPSPDMDVEQRISEALTAYGQYLASECGYIQLDGLPADTDIGSLRLKLERLFVPLHLDVTVTVNNEERRVVERQPIGLALAEHPRLAILAPPGGGKSTLIKHLAVAFADPKRRGQTDDFPQGDYLPLFFRCRELRELSRASFAELLDALSEHEPVRRLAGAFRTYVDRALLSGRVLLLVDGLDEISDAGDRAAFVCTLRSVLQTYPGVAIVVTSREAGFRHVAAHLASICTKAMLSPFSEDDTRRLSVAWHREVLGDTEKVRADAEQLAATIMANDRIQKLAMNPLLLTTLLLVKRWIGSLPTGRAVLYGEAVKVLLRTWNTEGYEPIPEEEALPQLCFVASAMMFHGVQKISRPRLAALVRQARNALPMELGYVKGTVDQFIYRVEERSSLLMMAGHGLENGQLVEFFEFRHRTFQEFLAARAIVEGWHPNRQANDTLVSVLEPYFDDENWREVIPLVSVLGRRATEDLIRRLTEMLGEMSNLFRNQEEPLLLVLGQCLADEAPGRPEVIRAALSELVRWGNEGEAWEEAPFWSVLSRGKYGGDLRQVTGEAFLSRNVGFREVGAALATVVWWQSVGIEDVAGVSDEFTRLLKSTDLLKRCEGALGIMYLCNLLVTNISENPTFIAESLGSAGEALVTMLYSNELPEQYAAAMALSWLGDWRGWKPSAEPDVLGRLFWLWQHATDGAVRWASVVALASQSLEPRDGGHCASISRKDFEAMQQGSRSLLEWHERMAPLVVAWYLRTISDAELVKGARALLGSPSSTANELLEHAAAAHRTARMEAMLKDVTGVEPRGSHRLHLRFSNGLEGEVDLDKLISFTGIFEPLREAENFEQVRIDPELGTICWPNGADLDPEMLYAAVIEKPRSDSLVH